MALGGLTKGVSNLELTTAFASVANGGVYNKATFYTKIVDHDGNVLLDKTPVVTKTQNKKGEDVTVVTTSSSKQVMKDRRVPLAGKCHCKSYRLHPYNFLQEK